VGDVRRGSDSKEEASGTVGRGNVLHVPSFKGATSRGVECNENTTIVVSIATRFLKDCPPFEVSDGKSAILSECLLSHDYVDVVFISLVDEERDVVGVVECLTVP